MIKTQVDLKEFLPISRERAALIASVASRYQCTLTLERDGIVLNLKSMIGLLSQSIPRDGEMNLMADGEDERAATQALREILEKKR